MKNGQKKKKNPSHSKDDKQKPQEERLLMDLYFNEISMITFISSTETYINYMVSSDLILFSTLLTYQINSN